ncbi:Ser-Thr-rich glycosyl-phosphatidyl-inositol-anchored membrane family-domain-containing protein [Corynascus novoguineensis]|uniref:Ser-Thr-rich glycosyl-phosphatidyl-inositol-anchored membrane family-domain-containing protein n=1 Tax=Corynascus novoguineensis TaxID=1126955 RepID=A0AAN7HJ66_9PEZI|nr:Ser-Thr-rich glycosyl-phosphatidyl-inositol-anchored membrane family-domain-containing protein [Corynascus novoguineensis]
MRTQVAVLLALAAPLYAVEITSPSKNDVVDPSKGVTVKWSTVSTDPARAHLVLVNMAAGHTPFTKDLGEVDLSTGSLTISQKDVPSDAGYQFNFESTAAQNTGILAQSEQFEVKSSSSSSLSSSSFHTEDDQSTSAAASSSSASTGTTAVRSMTSSLTSAGSVTTITGASRTLATSTTAAAAATGSETGSAASSTSTAAAAAATGMASQSGSLLALVIGVAAVLA